MEIINGINKIMALMISRWCFTLLLLNVILFGNIQKFKLSTMKLTTQTQKNLIHIIDNPLHSTKKTSQKN